MTKLQQAIDRVQALDPVEQDRIADLILAATNEDNMIFRLTPEEEAELERRIKNPGKMYAMKEVFGTE